MNDESPEERFTPVTGRFGGMVRGLSLVEIRLTGHDHELAVLDMRLKNLKRLVRRMACALVCVCVWMIWIMIRGR